MVIYTHKMLLKFLYTFYWLVAEHFFMPFSWPNGSSQGHFLEMWHFLSLSLYCLWSHHTAHVTHCPSVLQHFLAPFLSIILKEHLPHKHVNLNKFSFFLILTVDIKQCIWVHLIQRLKAPWWALIIKVTYILVSKEPITGPIHKEIHDQTSTKFL